MSLPPAFGHADLSNCEQEPIHLAGSIQSHGALLVLREDDLRIVQASANAQAVLGVDVHELLGAPLHRLGAALADQLARQRNSLPATPAPAPVMFQCRLGADERGFDASVHRHAGGLLVLELEPQRLGSTPSDSPFAESEVQDLPPAVMSATLSEAVRRFGAAASVGVLTDAVAQVLRELTGYDRVVVYKFDPDGHGKVVAESRHPRLDSLLGHHYPAGDIPAQARALYLLNRMRTLVDVDAPPARLVPTLLEATGAPLDMSMCQLRSMSPIHLQYLRNMGVTATMSASLVREGQLWGLVAAHHYRPRILRCTMRAAVELLAEVASTRLSAIENYAYAQVALMVRRLQQRLIEATSTEGDWRYALFRTPRTLLQPLEATGAALFCEGEVLTSGEVPSTPELHALLAWVQAQAVDGRYACSSIGQANTGLESLTPTASGVLAVRLSTNSPDWLMWFRKEQLQSITWAGDPAKVSAATTPQELSPRRSFAAWSEIVRGTAVPWSSTELALAKGIGEALVDIIVQVHAVRLLIAEHQLERIRATVAGSREPVLIANPDGRLIFANEALLTLHGGAIAAGTPVADLFESPSQVQDALAQLRATQHGWRRDLELRRLGTGSAPMAVHAELVAGRDGKPLGLVLTLLDLRESRRADSARVQLENALQMTAQRSDLKEDQVLTAILTNASLAAMDVADARSGPPVAPLFEELETSTRRAASLYAQIRAFAPLPGAAVPPSPEPPA